MERETSGQVRAGTPRPAARRAQVPKTTPHAPRRLARSMFYAHLWLGVVATGILVVISITGILLNHGILVATAAMLGPPILWAGGSIARDFAVHWSMLIGFVAGYLVGPMFRWRSAGRGMT